MMLLRLAVEEGSSSPDPLALLAYIPGPIGAFLAVALVLLPIVSEVKGWTNGPLAKRVSKAAEKAQQEKDSRDEQWIERDRRVEELTEIVNTLKSELDRQKEQIILLHRIGDAQGRLIVTHGNWDRKAATEINRLGGHLEAPPPLYVILADDEGTIVA